MNAKYLGQASFEKIIATGLMAIAVGVTGVAHAAGSAGSSGSTGGPSDPQAAVSVSTTNASDIATGGDQNPSGIGAQNPVDHESDRVNQTLIEQPVMQSESGIGARNPFDRRS